MTPTVARLRLISGDHDDLLSLRAWLDGEDVLRGRVLVEPAGTAATVIVIPLGTGGAVTALARALPTWLRCHTGVTIEIRDSKGTTVRVSGKGAVDAQALIESTLNAGHNARREHV